MGSLSPAQVALLIIAALSVLGVIITFIRTRMTYTGYEDIAGEIRRLGHSLGGEVFRDDADVVVSGRWAKQTAVVRFSIQENTPGLNIRMPAPTTFQLSVSPSSAPVTEGGRIPVKTTDENFDMRFTARTDQPTQARMFLTRQSTALLQRLACSKNTYVSIGRGEIELSELVVPAVTPAQHVIEHLKAMVALGNNLRTMPGAEKVKVVQFHRDRHVVARLAMVVGAIVAIGSIFAAMEVPQRPATAGANPTLASGILPSDALVIGNAERWRAASADDLDPSAVGWLRGTGRHPESRIEGDFGGGGQGRDVSYLLVGPGGSRRVVIIAGHENRYDAGYPYVGLIARIPKSAVASIRWQEAPQGAVGDGVLLVKRPDDGTSGVVIFLTPQGIVSAVPANYQEITLQ